MKPAPLLALGKTASPKGIKQDTTEPLYFYSHPVFWHFPEGQGRDRVGKRLRQEGEGGSPFPSDPSLPNHTGSTHNGGGEAQKPPPVEEAAQSYTHATQTSPLHAGPAGSQRSRALWGQGQESNSLLTDRQPAPPVPLPAPSPKSPECPPHFAWPFSHSL